MAVGSGMEDSGSLHGNVSESVLSRPHSLLSIKRCTSHTLGIVAGMSSPSFAMRRKRSSSE